MFLIGHKKGTHKCASLLSLVGMLHYGRPILGVPVGFGVGELGLGVDVGCFGAGVGAGVLGLDTGRLFPEPPEFSPLEGFGELAGLLCGNEIIGLRGLSSSTGGGP